MISHGISHVVRAVGLNLGINYSILVKFNKILSVEAVNDESISPVPFRYS